MLHFPEERNPLCDGYGNGEYIVRSLHILFPTFFVHVSVSGSVI
jgi:hypothetical protein